MIWNWVCAIVSLATSGTFWINRCAHWPIYCGIKSSPRWNRICWVRCPQAIHRCKWKCMVRLSLESPSKVFLFMCYSTKFDSYPDLCICFLADSNIDVYINLSQVSVPNDAYQVVDDITKLLQKSENFVKLSAFVSTRSPMLSSLHIKTGCYVNLNLFDRISTINSPILAHLLTFDSRIDFLATVIKCWMKVHHCYGPHRITSYAMMWMLVFYLQSISIIPPILHFQMHVPEMIINDFNFAFDYSYPNNTRNTQRCAELLLGFFTFYSRFNFENLVICPLFGRAFAKNDIKAKKLPEFEKYEALMKSTQNKGPLNLKNCICIQDPFEITQTIPIKIGPKVFSRFLAKITTAAELIENELQHSGESTKLFLGLFDVNFFHQKADEKYQENECYLKPWSCPCVFSTYFFISINKK